MLFSRLFQEKNFFTTWLIGLLVACMLALALLLNSLLGARHVTYGVIWLVVILPIIGIIMHFLTNRLLYVKLYFIAVGLSMGLIYAITSVNIVTFGLLDNLDKSIFLGNLLTISLFMLVVIAFQKTISSPNRKTMPHDDRGVLNIDTGIVDPVAIPKGQGIEVIKQEAQLRRVWRVGPVIAGVSLLVARALPLSVDMFLLSIAVLFFAIGGAYFAGKSLAFAVAIYRWEKAHGKPICVKR